MREEGLLPGPLKEKAGQNADVFDLIRHYVFGKELLTKEQRAEKAKASSAYSLLSPDRQKIIDELLKKYTKNGADSLENLETLKTPSMKQFGTPLEIIDKFNGKESYLNNIRAIIDKLYE